MTGTTIFEKVFTKMDGLDGLFIRLTCSEDNELQYVSVKNITLVEGLGLVTPTMVIEFVDGTGDFTNHNRLDTDALYTLYFGREMTTATQTPFKIVDIQTASGTQGRTNNMSFSVVFAQKMWQELSVVKHNRGWENKRYDEIISEIVSDKGFDEVDVEESDSIITNILQISKTDNAMINDIQQKATPSSHDGHYVYSARLDNKFFFKSTLTLIDKGMELRKEDKLPKLQMGGQPPRDDRAKTYSGNKNIPTAFTGFGSVENYAKHLKNGVTSIESSFYDWEGRTYNRVKKGLADINATQLSEWSLVREATDFVSKKVFGGRLTNVMSKSINNISEMSLQMQDVFINLEGQIELHVGDIVEVIIPTTEDSNTPYNEMYSGYYMVSNIKHQMTLNKATDFVSQLTLTRNGMDAKDMKGYVRSKQGRVSA